MTLSSFKVALFATLFLFLAACGGIPGNEKKAAKALPDTIAAANTAIATAQQAFTAGLRADAEIAGIVRSENVAADFGRATAETVRATRLYDSEVLPILKRNDEKELPQLRAAVARVNAALRSSREIAQQPRARFTRLFEAKRNSGPWPEQAQRLAASARTDHAAIAALSARYQQSYPTRREAIVARTASGERLIEQIRNGADAVASEGANKTAARPVNYARFADGHTAVVNGQRELSALRQRLARDLPSLDRAYSKVLIDMKADYSVCVSRTSWNEGMDEYPTETQHDYPCAMVPEAAFDTAEQFDDANSDFATHQSGWSDWSTSFERIGDSTAATEALWSQLRLSPRASWPQGDNTATYWVRETLPRYFHRYAIIENGVRRNGDWVQVTPELYEEHWDDLGMSIVEKPFGAFEDEAVRTAAPAGMALVGDSRAGEWRNTSNGGSFWFWYPLFMNSYGGGHYGPGWNGYSRSEWDGYNRSRREGDGYYGSAGRSYGSAGSTTQTGPLRGSDFARRGGFREAAASARTAGPNGRSGGPQSGK